MHVVLTTEAYLEVAIENSPEWDLSTQPLNAVQILKSTEQIYIYIYIYIYIFVYF